MPRPHILKIAEIFSSVQGEGLRQGEPTIFIRLSGCNLRCSFCDTKSAWESGNEHSYTDILEKAKKLKRRFPAEWVCLTGGEPFVQDIGGLVRRLKKEKFRVQIETNATIFRPMSVDWLTISPKPEKYFFQPQYKKLAQEVKVIVTKGLNLETVRELRAAFPERTPLLLQPQSNKKWSMSLGMKILRSAMSAGLKNIRLSVQLHKIYGIH